MSASALKCACAERTRPQARRCCRLRRTTPPAGRLAFARGLLRNRVNGSRMLVVDVGEDGEVRRRRRGNDRSRPPRQRILPPPSLALLPKARARPITAVGSGPCSTYGYHRRRGGLAVAPPRNAVPKVHQLGEDLRPQHRNPSRPPRRAQVRAGDRRRIDDDVRTADMVCRVAFESSRPDSRPGGLPIPASQTRSSYPSLPSSSAFRSFLFWRNGCARETARLILMPTSGSITLPMRMAASAARETSGRRGPFSDRDHRQRQQPVDQSIQTGPRDR